MATIDPLPLASRCGSAACARRTVCMRSTSNEVYQFSSRVRDRQGADVRHDGVEPAHPLGGRRHPAGQRRAVADVELDAARPGRRPASAFSVASISPASRAQNSTAAPSATNASTIARPMPRVPPVTSTREPLQLQVHGRFSSRTQRSGAARPRSSSCSPPYAVAARQQRLRGLDDGAVVRVDDVGDRRPADLREQLVGVHRVQAVELAEPAHQLDLADPPGVLERPARPDRHPVGVVLQPRPARARRP